MADTIKDALQRIKQLRGTDMGLMVEDVEKVDPCLLDQCGMDMKEINTARVLGLLVEAIKEMSLSGAHTKESSIPSMTSSFKPNNFTLNTEDIL